MRAKAQASTETIAVMLVMFVIFAIMLSLTGSKQLEAGDIKYAMEKQNACDSFASEVKSVFVLGNGTRSTLELAYDFNISNRTVIAGSTMCRLCCSVTRNSSPVFTIPAGIRKLENIDGAVFSTGPRITSTARYSKPAHAFVSDETGDVTKKDGTYVTVDKDNRVLHVAFDTPLASDKVTAFVRCRNDETIQMKNEPLGTVLSSASCVDDVWMWVNFTATGSVFDLNANSRDVDYDFVGVIW